MSKLIVVCVLAGLLSGLLSWASLYWLDGGSVMSFPSPGIALGLALYGLGEYLHITPAQRGVWPAVFLVVFTVIGWKLSISFGYNYGEPIPYVAAGAVGAITVALGAVLAWKLRQRRTLFVLLITGAGALGGLIFQEVDARLDMSEAYSMGVMFLEWQIILLLGVGMALATTRRGRAVFSSGAGHE